MKEGVLESTSAENGARAFVQHIESCIEGSLSPAAAKTVTPDDKADLERALSALRPSFDELAKCFFDPVREQKPAFCEHGYHVLWRLIRAAFAAGSRGTMSVRRSQILRKTWRTSASGIQAKPFRSMCV